MHIEWKKLYRATHTQVERREKWSRFVYEVKVLEDGEKLECVWITRTHGHALLPHDQGDGCSVEKKRKAGHLTTSKDKSSIREGEQEDLILQHLQVQESQEDHLPKVRWFPKTDEEGGEVQQL